MKKENEMHEELNILQSPFSLMKTQSLLSKFISLFS